MKQQQLLKTLKRIGEGSPKHGHVAYANATGPVRGVRGALRLGSTLNESAVKLQQRVSNANVGPLVATLQPGDSFGEEEILRDFDALPKESDLVKRRGGNPTLSVATGHKPPTPKTKARRASCQQRARRCPPPPRPPYPSVPPSLACKVLHCGTPYVTVPSPTCCFRQTPRQLLH